MSIPLVAPKKADLLVANPSSYSACVCYGGCHADLPWDDINKVWSGASAALKVIVTPSDPNDPLWAGSQCSATVSFPGSNCPDKAFPNYNLCVNNASLGWHGDGQGCCGNPLLIPSYGLALFQTFFPSPIPTAPRKTCSCETTCSKGGGGGPPPSPSGPSTSSYPVEFATGNVVIRATDIDSNGFGMLWGHSRSFSNRLATNWNFGNGTNWVISQLPSLSAAQWQGNNYVAVVGDPNGGHWFRELAGDAYQAEFGEVDSLRLDRSAEVYRWYTTDGAITEFQSRSGRFLRRYGPGEQRLEVTSVLAGTTKPVTVERTYTSGGFTTKEQLFYEYTPASAAFLLSVTLRRKITSNISSSSSSSSSGDDWTNVTKVIYTYYGSNEPFGGGGDLKTATTYSWVAGTWGTTGTSYYRYWTASSSNSSSSSGSSSPLSGSTVVDNPHLLKFVINPAAFERLKNDPAVSDPLTASEAIVSQYADYYFEYDTQRRVTKERAQSGSLTFTFAFTESNFSNDYNQWKTKTIETQPDGTQIIVFANYAGQTMLKIFKSGSDQWCDFYKYDSSGKLSWHAHPSAVTGYDETKADLLNAVAGNYQYLRDNDGLIETYSYDSTSQFLAGEFLQKGELGTSLKLREYEYTSCCVSSSSSSSFSSSSSSSSSGCTNPSYFLSKLTEYPSDTDQTKKVITTYAYTFYSGTCAIQQKTTTLPVVSSDQFGSGVAATKKEYFDQYGNLTWSMDERGFITRMKYDIVTGAMTQRIDDVDTSVETDAPSGWTTPSGGGLNLKTDFASDDQGRITQVLGASHAVDLSGVPGGGGSTTMIRRATWTVYEESSTGTVTYSGQGYQDTSDDSFTLINPVSITKTDLGGRVNEQIQATASSTAGTLADIIDAAGSGEDAFPQSSYVRWTTTQYTDCCFAASQRVYHTIPASGEGSSGTNYDETDYGYSVMKRQNRVVTPGGTITDTVYDARGQVIGTYVGTNDDGATEEDPTGGGSDPDNNMVLVTENQFDNGLAGYDGNLTTVTQYVTASDTRVTNMCYDWRDRRDGTDGEIDFYEQTYYDNFDRVIKTERYDTVGPCTSSSSSSSSSGSTLGNLIARSETKFDDRGRVYQTIRYAVDVTTGIVGNSLTDNSWFDDAGNVIKQLPAGSSLFTKTEYDSLNRPSIRYSGYDLDETGYPG